MNYSRGRLHGLSDKKLIEFLAYALETANKDLLMCCGSAYGKQSVVMRSLRAYEHWRKKNGRISQN